jgi:hypothetical protein
VADLGQCVALFLLGAVHDKEFAEGSEEQTFVSGLDYCCCMSLTPFWGQQPTGRVVAVTYFSRNYSTPTDNQKVFGPISTKQPEGLRISCIWHKVV